MGKISLLTIIWSFYFVCRERKGQLGLVVSLEDNVWHILYAIVRKV